MSARDFDSLTHSDHGKPLQWWRYNERFAIAGFITRQGRRIGLPAVSNGSACYWHEPLPPLPPLPLYGEAPIADNPDAPILVVLSERAADAARLLFPTHVCITWACGPNAVFKANLLPMKGRRVILWRDNDGAGITAMARIAERLRPYITPLVASIDIPSHWPRGWSLAQGLPAGVTEATLRRMLHDATASLPAPVEKSSADPVPQAEAAAPTAAAMLSTEQDSLLGVCHSSDASSLLPHVTRRWSDAPPASALPAPADGAAEAPDARDHEAAVQSEAEDSTPGGSREPREIASGALPEGRAVADGVSVIPSEAREPAASRCSE